MRSRIRPPAPRFASICAHSRRVDGGRVFEEASAWPTAPRSSLRATQNSRTNIFPATDKERIDVDAARRELVAAMQDAHRRGWCDGTGGNFSVVIARSPTRLLMAPSGVDKGRVAPAELVEVDAAARVVAGTGRASAEALLHLEIVARSGAGAVLHTHSQAATLLSLAAVTDGAVELQGLEMLKGLEGVSTHEARVRIPVVPNDQDLARLSAAASGLLADAPFAILVAGHGLYAWGKDLFRARRHLEIVEFLLEHKWRRSVLEAIGGIARR
jgi:methylthioribulose-1-phosphate dehydratase